MKKFERNKEFLTTYHVSLTTDLNHISDDLLRAKWFLLVAIGATGISYWYIFNIQKEKVCPIFNMLFFEKTLSFQEVGYFIVCLMANLIYWLISEYSLSHAFLYRLIQTRLAKIENKFDKALSFKDPSKIEKFIYKNKKIDINYIIPDQFLPIYWSVTWLIILNTLISIFLQYELLKPIWCLFYALVSIPFIWKLWKYYCYKTNKFIKDNKLKIVYRKYYDYKRYDYKDYYDINTSCASLIGALVFGGSYCAFILILSGEFFELKLLILYSLLGWFWPVFVGLIFHICRVILQLRIHEFQRLVPEAKKIDLENCENAYEINCNYWSRIFYVLYSIT